MERHLILLLAVLAAGLGSGAAVLRPGVFQIGQGTPLPQASGVIIRSGAARQGSGARLVPGGRARWERFQGRGPGGAK